MAGRKKKTHPVLLWFLLAVIAAVVFSRHLPTAEAVGIGAGIGLITGAIGGYRSGSRRKAIAPGKPKTASTARARPKSIEPLPQISGWCLDGGASHGACDGVGCDCTTCDHQGARRHRRRKSPPAPVIPPSSNDDKEPPF